MTLEVSPVKQPPFMNMPWRTSLMEKLLSKPDLLNAPELGGITHGIPRARGEGSEENGVSSLICVKR